MTSRCGSSIRRISILRRKYPVYMLLHGGPHNGITDGTQWRWNAEVFAGWGYITTWHNFHGSSGFGQAFTDSINPDRISMPYEDTIKAAEYLMSKPYVDSARMAAGGGSYGGFLATTLLGRPHPFKTLVAHAAVYNEFTQYAARLRRGEDAVSSTTGTSPRNSRATRRTVRRRTSTHRRSSSMASSTGACR